MKFDTEQKTRLVGIDISIFEVALVYTNDSGSIESNMTISGLWRAERKTELMGPISCEKYFRIPKHDVRWFWNNLICTIQNKIIIIIRGKLSKITNVIFCFFYTFWFSLLLFLFMSKWHFKIDIQWDWENNSNRKL